MKRIEINLSEETDKAIKANAKQANRSRKNYIETLCEIDAKKKPIKVTRVKAK